MYHTKKLLAILTAFVCAVLFGGCYTKLATYQNDTMPTGSSSGARCSDCREEVAVGNRREVCVWERDIFGFPEMRCYSTNYASSWVYFHNTPWWYRNNYAWYDTRGCPPYYYYDRRSGICRYYGGGYVPPHGRPTGGGSGGGMTPGTVTPNRSSRVMSPDEAAPVNQPSVGSAPMFTGSVKNLSPAGTSGSSSASPPQQSPDPALSKPNQDNVGQAQSQPPAAEQPQRPTVEQQSKPKDDSPRNRSSRVVGK